MIITQIVNQFDKSTNPTHRYSSFDYCYNHFYKNQNNVQKDMEKSCAIIGFYLASWGMMRGSSFLLQKSYKYYEPLIEYIANLDVNTWDIDVKDYDNKSDFVIDLYNDIRSIIIDVNQRDIVLVTKIMLGVLGIAPAYDAYFCEVFRLIQPEKSRFRTFNKSSLEVIFNFYKKNKAEIDELSKNTKTIDFKTGNQKYCYTQAKIIDMYGFTKGLSL
jgi:hypothetical protein